MKINNAEIQIQKREVQKLNNSLKNDISKKENEIKQVNTIHNQRLSKIKEQNKIQLHDTNKYGQNRISEALTAKETKLNEIKENLESQKLELDKEREVLSTGHRDKSNKMQHNFEERYQAKFFEGIDDISNIDEKNAQSSKQLQEKSNIEQSLLKENLSLDKEVVADVNSSKITELDNKYLQKISTKESLHARAIYNKEKQYNTETSRLNNKQKMALDQKKKIQAKELRDLEMNHNALMHEKEANFNSKYDQLSNNQLVVIDGIKSRFDKDLKDLVSSYSVRKDGVVDKSSDDFYKVKALDPFIHDYGDFYEVSLDVKDHESQNVQLTAENRTLKLSMTRKYSGESSDIFGDKNVSKRSETFTKKIDVDHILDKGSVTQKLENGVLYFRVSKS